MKYKARGVSLLSGYSFFLINIALYLFLSSLLLAASAYATGDNYSLGTGDRIKITVYGEEDLSMETTLGESGVISYPFLGEITVDGMTRKKLEDYIHQHLDGDYLLNPNVHVSIEEYRPFYINGQVKAPGGYPYQPGLTIQRAVSLAGGFTERASKKKIYIVHENKPQHRVHATQHMRVKPGDIITVEESFF